MKRSTDPDDRMPDQVTQTGVPVDSEGRPLVAGMAYRIELPGSRDSQPLAIVFDAEDGTRCCRVRGRVQRIDEMDPQVIWTRIRRVQVPMDN